MPDLYTDGGCIQRNPSPIGGTYAWLLVEQDEVIQSSSGLILVRGVEPAPVGAYLVDEPVSGNLAEWIAAACALRMMPLDWAGRLCSDSGVTLGRLFQGWTLKGIPLWWQDYAGHALSRLGYVGYTLLQGHPTRADLAAGIGAKRGLPVSKWNVRADEMCQEVARNYLAKRQGVVA